MLISDPPYSYSEISNVLENPLASIGPERARCPQRLRCSGSSLHSSAMRCDGMYMRVGR